MFSEQGGTVLCALFGPQSSATYDLDYLLQRWLEPPVVTTIGVMILAFVGSIPVDRWLSDDSGQSKRAARWRFMRAGIWAYRGGSVGGVANIMFKGTGELLQSGSLSTVPLAVVGFAIVTFCLAAVQFLMINMGLQRFDGTLFLPLYSGWYIICGVLDGSIFYEEYTCYTALQWVVFPIGCSTSIVGMLRLSSIHPPAPEPGESLDPSKEAPPVADARGEGGKDGEREGAKEETRP
jgi:hypothetical protein